MAIKKVSRFTGAASATPAYARKKISGSMDPHAGTSAATERSLAASCVDSNLFTSHRWTCSTWMATRITPPSII